MHNFLSSQKPRKGKKKEKYNQSSHHFRLKKKKVPEPADFPKI
jgi:hypothetical protein